MQTAIRITNGGSGTSYYQRSRMHRCQPGDKQPEKKKAAARRGHNDFLTGRILPVAPDYYMELDEEEKINLTTKENFDFLYSSALKYAGLADVKLPFRKSQGTPRMNISKLYKAMDDLLPENINLEVVNEKLYFCIYRFHDWPDHTLFWIPLKFTEKLPRLLKRITLEFIRRLICHHGIQNVTESYYCEMAIESLKGYGGYEEEATAAEIRRKANLARMYKEGKVHRILERIGKKKFCTDLDKEMQQYHTKKNKELELLKLISEGMEFISPDSPGIMRYYYDWAYEESPDFRPIGLDIQIMLTWSIYDDLTCEMEDYFNSDYQESYVITPVTTLYLTPETEQLFTMDDFPERFSKWLLRFTRHIANNF